jgi:hypothetical protein
MPNQLPRIGTSRLLLAIVRTRRPSSARDAMKAATVAGSAGRACAPLVQPHAAPIKARDTASSTSAGEPTVAKAYRR